MSEQSDRAETTASQPDRDELLSLARQAAATLSGEPAASWSADDEQESWIQRTADVLAANRESGRIETVFRDYLAGQGDHSDLVAYARQVLLELRAEYTRIQRLCEGDTSSWLVVIGRMKRLAYYRLNRAGSAEWAIAEAQEVAAYACAQLWDWLERKPYPFDVPFDRWSTTWLTNRLRELARKEQTRERHTADSLDRPLPQTDGLTLQDVLPDRSFDEWLENTANREALSQAIERLPNTLAAVVRLWYLEEWCADEIAAFLGRRVSYVYVLRFRAIQKLRQVALDERSELAAALPLMRDEQRRLELADLAETPIEESRS